MSKANCIIALNASYYLKHILRDFSDDIMLFDNVMNSEEFRLLLNLTENLDKLNLCNKCEGCLDFAFLNNSLNKFIGTIDSLVKENEDLFLKIVNGKDLFVQTKQDVYSIFISILKYRNDLDDSLTEIEKQKLDKLHQNLLLAHQNLILLFLRNKISDCHDKIFHNMHLLEHRETQYKEIETELKETFYIDQNFVSEYIKNKRKFANQVSSFIETSNSHLVFSPFLIEDGIKMNQLFYKKYIEILSKITNNIMVINENNQLSFKQEELEYTTNRVSLFLEMTRAAEEKKIYELKINNILYSIFNKKSKYYEDINDDLEKFLIDNRTKQSQIYQELNHVIISKSYDFNLDMLIDKKYINLGHEEIIKKIIDISDFLDIINYKTEKISDSQKIKSSYQDLEHIKSAWICDYFVTKDTNLIDRASFIYSCLNIDTKILNIKELKKLISNHNRSFKI